MKIKIEVYEEGAPSATITIPVWVVRGAAKLLPMAAGKKLRERIDIDQILELTKDPQANGVILEIDDHKDNQRVVISIVNEGKAVLGARGAPDQAAPAPERNSL